MIRPHAVLVDQPGGPLDRIAADADVATFLNDRFHAWFVPAPGPPRTWFLTHDGCLLAPPAAAETAEAWVAAANAASVALTRRDVRTRPDLPPVPGLPPGHPLAAPCAGAQ